MLLIEMQATEFRNGYCEPTEGRVAHICQFFTQCSY
uniref:Uncharacterized protein n=1 Tax=Anguilla anguilla TaxID=7936 RepID=A0A0E9XCB2_ANGAN